MKGWFRDFYSCLVGVLWRENREDVKEEIMEELVKLNFLEKENVCIGFY